MPTLPIFTLLFFALCCSALSGFAQSLQYHAVSGFHDHKIYELYGLYNLSSGHMGAILDWQEAIPPLGPFVIGAELGFVPTESGFDGYLSLELGYALDL